MEIKEIDPKHTWPLRHKILWPDQPYDFVKLPKDNLGRHFGVFVENQLVSIVSLFYEGKVAQFRKLATDFDQQGKGFGTALLNHLITVVEEEGFISLWCNARVEKAGFYHRFGMCETDQTFVKEDIDYVVMERLFD